jgi:alkanesulfonate monooxygenase SsuD/methylene tetrahydromethanopterin reductase-like flavin-dependent oxidoreductase (luciferase family)
VELALSLNGVLDDVIEDARWAEAAGFAAIALPDHLLRAQATDPAVAARLPAPDPFVQLAVLARETRTVELATLCSPVTFRHPAVLLKAAIELDHASRGRFTLGLGTGYRAEEHEVFGVPFPEREDRYVRLEDVLGYVRAGMRPDHPGFEGRGVRLAAHPVSPLPRRLRLLVGGGGPARTPRIAGRYADEYNVFVDRLDAMAERIAVARDAYAASGRVGALTISAAAPLITGRTVRERDDELARQAARVARSPAALADEHRRPGSLFGTVEDIVRRISDLARVGVSRLYLVFDGPVDRVGLAATLDGVRSSAFGAPGPTTLAPDTRRTYTP